MFEKRKKTIYALLIVMLICALLPYLGVLFYSLPRNDEFAAAASVKEFGGHSLYNAIRVMLDMYRTWEGNYSGHFLWAFFNPISWGGIGLPVYISNIISFLFFIILWSYILYRCLSLFDMDRDYKIFLIVVLLILSLNCRFMRETLGWYTGFIYYTFILLVGAMGASLTVSSVYDESKSVRHRVILMICAGLCNIVAVGGVLQLSGLFCWISFFILLYSVLDKKKYLYAAVPFAFSLVFTVINLLSPGYYIRKNNYESISILRASSYTVTCILNEIRRIFSETYIPYVFLLIFVLGFVFVDKEKCRARINPLMTFLCMMMSLFASTLPVCYGYGRIEIASRGYEIMDLIIVLGLALTVLGIVCTLKSIGVELSKEGMTIIFCTAFMLFSVYSFNNISISEIPSVKCAIQLADGSVKEFSDYWRGVLSIAADPDKKGDVEIGVDEKYLDMQEDVLIDRFQIQEDPDNWINIDVAKLYDHKSVRIYVVE